MCGIVAVLRGPSTRSVPDGTELVAQIRAARQATAPYVTSSDVDPATLAAAVAAAAAALDDVDSALRGGPGLRCLLDQPGVSAQLEAEAAAVEELITALENAAGASRWSTTATEQVNAALMTLKDAWWAIGRDRVGFAAEVGELAGDLASPAAVEAYAAILIGLRALDRLELRGRDSAGLHVLVSGHGLDLNDHDIATRVAARRSDGLFTSGAIRTPGSHLSFVYKHAAEIGRLGDNGRALRAAIAGDELLRAAVQAPTAQVVVLGHTRWASVGMINQVNAHPLTSEETGAVDDEQLVFAALNGDVDNHAELVARHGLDIAADITTDAKVIPVLTARRLMMGMDPVQAWRATVEEFEGSVAIAAHPARYPRTLLLAQRGSGQALYIGSAESTTVVASELYGLVEECRTYVRMDGETTETADGRQVAPGQIVALDADRAGRLDAVGRWSYNGIELPFTPAQVRTATITTRDIDLRGYEHFLAKELAESPESLRKTLRGRVGEVDGKQRVTLGTDTIPAELTRRLAAHRITRVIVIGQGTAAVAGSAVATAIGDALAPQAIPASATTGTELSGFGLTLDMSDTLAVAISQSGTTTDTNRAVDLLRARGAIVLAIVNRRGSDLTDKADGVLYTADGRDVEMSVASTKAFYSQIAAGQLLALALAQAAGCADPAAESALVTALLSLPEAMRTVLDSASDKAIAELAHRHGPQRSAWAVVGSGRNRIAAQEIRIKCSELTYKSIGADETSDKKHIDLSAEPLTIVCAAGLTGSAAADAAKETAIFAAHNGIPIVIVTEGEHQFTAAAGVIPVPRVHPDLAFVLSALAGHLFGYHAARAIDEQAQPLRHLRAAIERAAHDNDTQPGPMLATLAPELRSFTDEITDRLTRGRYNGAMTAATSARIITTLHAAAGTQSASGAVIDDLVAALTVGIDEVSRTIDTIRHQAKTVTVGTSRSDESVLSVPLVRALIDAGGDRTGLPFAVLRDLSVLDHAVAAVTGHTRYRIDNVASGATIAVVATGGIAAAIPSRTAVDPTLRGAKQRVADERQVLVAIGRADGRPVIIVPEYIGSTTTGLVLLHVEFHPSLPADSAARMLNGYRGRLAELRTAVTETEPDFDEQRFASIAPVRLLTDPIEALADHWYSPAGLERPVGR